MSKAKTPIGKIDELINFYEKFKPDAGQKILTNFTPKELGKHLGQFGTKQTEFPYRGRILVAKQDSAA